MKTERFIQSSRCAMAIVAVAALFTSLSLRAQVAPSRPLVTTTGEAEVMVAPDQARLSFGIETRLADLKAARTANAEAMKKVIAFCKEQGIEDKDMQTSEVEIEPYYDSNEHTGTQAKVRFYEITRRLTVLVHSVSTVEDIVSGALAAGVTNLYGVSLESSELRKHRDAARKQAILAAKEKAEALTAALETSIGAPFSIVEEPPAGAPFVSTANSISSMQRAVDLGGDGGGAGAFAPGQIRINARITVSFEITAAK